MPKKFYITTPLYYPNAQPHLGTTLSTVIADVINRYKKIQNYETRFVTGLDEHGFKIWKKAAENNEDPQIFVNKMALIYQDLWKKCGISYDCFTRTSNLQHQKQVRAIFSKMVNNEDVYYGDYKANYCENCSEFLNYHQINIATKTCLTCEGPVTVLSEASYFLKVKQYQNFLIDLINQQNFLIPSKYAQELNQNFLQQELHDLSITRQNTTWGIKIKPDEPFVIYVWFDALLAYITNLNLFNQQAPLIWNDFWQPTTEIIHVIGKEITRFHAIYWPLMLQSLDLNLPTKVLVHGWLIMRDQKMSKSIGNVVNPHVLIDRYTRDVLRFFLASQIHFNRDFSYSHQLFLEVYNGLLVNDLGNLFSRFTKMAVQYCDGKIVADHGDPTLIKTAQLILHKFQKAFDEYNLNQAFAALGELTKKCNASIEHIKPWILAKNNIKQLQYWLYTWHYLLLVIATCYQPVLIDHAPIMLVSLGFSLPLGLADIKTVNCLKKSKTIKLCQLLFPRININQELSFLKKIG